jgi:hypothetical protein
MGWDGMGDHRRPVEDGMGWGICSEKRNMIWISMRNIIDEGWYYE